tara:strand:+ start:338 stop:535 length:198 start_codon:yes stop_codon:yes gene_type:complete
VVVEVALDLEVYLEEQVEQVEQEMVVVGQVLPQQLDKQEQQILVVAVVDQEMLLQVELAVKELLS